ncbi:MAG: glycosyltransferase family 2 protein [Flavobacteriaceae bacterium]|jgi:glycosyltransferase involved in cell wall biosynthesis|nr:glycosyltransferase family 2 protein [Flavobacteriaceae bacterium]
MQNPKITVAIPIYNTEKYLSFAIQSVINQTYKDWELILIDDGNTDQSLKIAKSFSDPRIKIIENKENKGISTRLNQIIEIAKGDYLCRMDGDDMMFPERLEQQIRFMQENPDVDVAGSYAVVIDDKNKILGGRFHTSNSKNEEQILKSTYFIHPTVFGKTEWFKQNKYTLGLDGVEDRELWFRTSKFSTFYIIEEPLLFYRDPLKFKLKIYVSRQRQVKKLYKNLAFLKDKKLLLAKLTFMADLKILIAKFMVFIKKDKYMISRRNTKLSDESIKKYYEILQTII